MPSIDSRISDYPGSSNSYGAAPSQKQFPSLPPAQPGLSQTLRTPLPNLVVTSSDSLRQYYAGGQIPQYRAAPLKPLSNLGLSSVTNITNNIVGGGGGSGSSGGGGSSSPSVIQIVAGTNISITPPGGTGVVTVNGVVVPATTAAILHQWLKSYDETTGLFTQTQPDFTDISGIASPTQLPTPTPTTIGGVESAGPVTHQWINQIDTSGVPHLSQPAFSDISGVAVWAQLPNPPYIAVTTTYAILLTDFTVECTSGTFTVTLPAGAALNQRFEVTNSGTGVITLGAAAGTIDGSSTQTLSQWDTLCVYWNGSNWRIK